jgi:tetratricopeptide (TPR) repeat protein
MSRWILALVLSGAGAVHAQDPKPPQPPQPADQPQGELRRRGQPSKQTPTKELAPPEEDTSLAVKEYTFNPLQAKKDITTGNYYFKKGSYRAAAGRFVEATKWNDGDTEAWLRLGEADEKLKDQKAAKEAYEKYLELAPEAKNAAEIRKKIEKWK